MNHDECGVRVDEPMVDDVGVDKVRMDMVDKGVPVANEDVHVASVSSQAESALV